MFPPISFFGHSMLRKQKDQNGMALSPLIKCAWSFLFANIALECCGETLLYRKEDLHRDALSRTLSRNPDSCLSKFSTKICSLPRDIPVPPQGSLSVGYTNGKAAQILSQELCLSLLKNSPVLNRSKVKA
jgi:hypothetical protein